MRLGYRLIKRTFDLCASVAALITLSPLFLILAAAIKLEDPRGKVFYKQPRFGINISQFEIYKFRSMFSNAEELFEQMTPEQKQEWETNFKVKDDPRITRVGDFIRKTSLDELPQLLNIIKGEMSIVGPRPPLVAEEKAYGEHLAKVMSVRPGLTGYWQAYGRNDISFEDRIKMNLYYIQNMSVAMDLRIIVKTISSVIKKEGAI